MVCVQEGGCVEAQVEDAGLESGKRSKRPLVAALRCESEEVSGGQQHCETRGVSWELQRK